MSFKMKLIAFKYLLIFAIVVLCESRVFASVNISLGSPLYRDIGTLSTGDLIKSSLLSTKPFTRSEAGRLLAEAVQNHEKGKSRTIDRLLDRLSKDYREEIAEAELTGGSAPENFLKPIDEFSFSYNFLDGPFSIYNNEGIDYFDGSNMVMEFQSRAGLWNIFSFYIQPMVICNQKYNGIDGNNETRFRLHKGYIKLTIDNFEIEVGRDSLWWGPGYHGSLIMSNNAKPFDMIKISNPRAKLLPWIFSYMGPFKATWFITRLEKDRAVPEPYLTGLRLNFKPLPILELGMSRVVMMGGKGKSDLDSHDILQIIWGENISGVKEDTSNQIASIDFSLQLPFLRNTRIYGEWGGEDEAGGLPIKSGYIAGIYVPKITPEGNVSLRAEYANNHVNKSPNVWYNHSVYKTGYTYKGSIIGHHAGTDSDDLFLELSHNIGENFSCELGFDRERRLLGSSSTTETRYQWFIKTEYDVTKRLNMIIKYSYEEIDNFTNIKDCKKKNHFVGTKFIFTF